MYMALAVLLITYLRALHWDRLAHGVTGAHEAADLELEVERAAGRVPAVT